MRKSQEFENGRMLKSAALCRYPAPCQLCKPPLVARCKEPVSRALHAVFEPADILGLDPQKLVLSTKGWRKPFFADLGLPLNHTFELEMQLGIINHWT